MQLDKYIMVNPDKVERALHGTIGSKGGQLVGGVGDDATDLEKLAEYDRLGGLIRIGDDKVKKGSFYDFVARKPRAKPEVMLEFSINGKTVTVDAEQPLPPLVRAAKEAAKEESNASTEDAEPKGHSRKGKGHKAKDANESDE